MGRRGVWVVAALAVMVSACTGGGAPKPSPTTTPHQGGQAIFGAEGWAECLNPINQCSAFPWTWYTVLEHVLPRAMQLDPKGNFVASQLLREAPSLENGLLTENPFTITYKISDKAVWADGSPITSADFDFTWKAILNTTGAYTTVGYTSIDSIDTTDPKTAAIKFKDVFVDWPDLFGGVYQGIFEKAAFPKFANSAKPNLAKEMQNAIPFSGGPWVLRSWSKQRAILVRNPRYFGRVAQFDQVTFVPKTDQLEELGALLRDDVQAIFPSPEMWSLIDPAKGLVAVRARGDSGTEFEALWIDHSKPPMDDPLVREAFLYAVDRGAILDAVVKPVYPGVTLLNCGFVAIPDLGGWCHSRPFERFTYDPLKARALLEQAGYDCSAPICAKRGRELRVEYSYDEGCGGIRRAQIFEIVRRSASAAGIVVKLHQFEGTGPFGCRYGLTPVGDAAVFVSPDPSVTASFSCDQTPAFSNAYVGLNNLHWCDHAADQLMRESDRQLDMAKRSRLFDRLYELQARDAVSLPLYVIPALSVWRTDKLGGPIAVWSPTFYGLFFNMNEWYLAS